jgi:hypothetical protein
VAGSSAGPQKQILDRLFTPKKCSKGQSDKITALTTEMIAVDMQPLSMVEDVGFNALIACVELDYKMSCRKTVTCHMEKLYSNCSASIKRELSNTIHGVNNRLLDVYEHTVMHHCSEPSH